MYRAKAVVKGTHPDGTAFVRTSQHLISVVDDSLTLTRATRYLPMGVTSNSLLALK